MKSLFVIICILFSSISYAQYGTNIDSLVKIIATSPDDTMKVKKINKICMELISYGKYDEAETFIKQSENLSNKLKFKKGQGNVLNFRGIICDDRGMISAALDNYFKALKIFEEINHYGGIADITNNIGLIYLNQNQLEVALSYFFKAKKYAELSKKRFILDNPINNIGSVYLKKKDYVNALKYYNESYQLRKELEFYEGCIQSLTNIGNVYMAQDDTLDAIKNYSSALEMAEKIHDEKSIAITKASLGAAYFKINKKQSVEYLKEALAIANDINFAEVKLKANKQISDYYEQINERATAFTYYKNYVAIKDSLFNSENTKKATSAELNYQFDRKQSIAKVEQEKKDALFVSEKKKQKLIIMFISLILVFALFFGAFVFNSLKKQRASNNIIAKQKLEVEEHQKEILDSIHYAKRIQNTLLAHHDFLDENLSNNFVLFKPKDIVSGDFYWATKHGDSFYLAVCDSTGHGVPGAFMSLLNIGFLNEAINEKEILEPDQVFSYVRQRLISSVSKEGQKDGFDGILLRINQVTNEITYAAAHNAPIIISNNKIIELEKDKMPVGKGEKLEDFTRYTIQVHKGDMLYLYTDGYADQFGGDKGKKFKYKPLNELLLRISSKPLEEQAIILQSTFENWKGNLEQVDDVCVIGIKY